MRKVVISIAVIAFGSVASGQQLDDAAVEAAIKADYRPLVSQCRAIPSFSQRLGGNMAGGLQPNGGYRVIVSGPTGRIALLAAQAKRLYQPFSADNVPADIKAGGKLFVTAIPDEPERSQSSIDVASPIERIVLKAKKGDAVAQPADLKLEPVQWQNLLGASFQGTTAVASFTLADVPAGDVEVILVTQAGERKCKLSAQDRSRVSR